MRDPVDREGEVEAVDAVMPCAVAGSYAALSVDGLLLGVSGVTERTVDRLAEIVDPRRR